MDRYAFVDESGNEGMQLEQPNVSSHYVVAALVLDEAQEVPSRHEFEAIKQAHFKNREIKSASVSHDGRRVEIAREVANVPCSIYLFICDKSRLSTTGFQYAKSFIKYLQGRLYDALIGDASNVRVIADRIKNPAFVAEFERYLLDRNPISLFSQWSFQAVDSKDEICVQVADFIAGTVARCYERDKVSPLDDELMRILQPRIVFRREFPPPFIPSAHDVEIDGTYDSQIECRAINDAWSFIDRFCASDERDRVLQVASLHLLLLQGRRNSDWWVQTDTLRRHLEKAFGEEIGEHKLRHLIGGLRDAGVLVASKTAGGYKLATCESDIVCFLERQNSQLEPMINRVQKAREIVKRATDARLDILHYKEYRQLKVAVNAVEQFRLMREKDGN